MTDVPSPADETLFSTEVEGLEKATEPRTVRLRDGDTFELSISPVRKMVGGAELRMLAYGGSVPGPTLHVDEGAEIEVRVTNAGDIDATVHWHGLRLENKYDGVPHETQAPIPKGGAFTYKVQFPDPGIYWYHPHLREDYALELGLYGTIVVEPSDPDYWPPADRQMTITLDDLLVEDGRIAPFRRDAPTHVAMGRYGNIMLTNGETQLRADAKRGEVVRLYLVNTANTRIFNVALPAATVKLIGGDSGRYEHETFVDEVMLAPSERAVVDVRFDQPGEVHLEHRTPDRTYDLGWFDVAGDSVDTAASKAFDTLRIDPALTAARQVVAAHLERAPDKTLAFYSLMPLLYGAAAQDGATASAYECPMHPDVTSSEPGTCPRCGMKLVPSETSAPVDQSHDASAHHHHDEAGDGLEWEDEMLEVNRQTNPDNMIWQLIDRDDDAVNADIAWSFTVGDQVKIRLVNEMAADHPMHHPFHVHGAGRMLILSRDGAPEANLVWKDTVLVRAGETVDVLLDVSNPGIWMAHCHIAEHNQSGMMFSFDVTPRR